ncbi:MAG: DNA-directed RNA polymerase subunit beta [Firmicutes bacterium]|nr:DNA-directed RNA polymerase subunit beta [Bacillota bacterium]
MSTTRRRKTILCGKTQRLSYAQVDEVIDMPNLIDVQKNSYADFIKEGIMDVFKDFSPITDFSGKIALHFLSCTLDSTPKMSEKECKDRDTTYAAPLKVKVRLDIHDDDGNVTQAVEQEVFMGDFPLMTPNGSFIVNGAERVVVSQLVRSPGVYFDEKKDIKTGQAYYSATNIPSRGAWLEFEEDAAGLLWVKVDRTRKIPVTVLLRALSSITGGMSTDEEIAKLFNNEKTIVATLEKDANKNEEAALIELNRKLRPGEVPNSDSIRGQLEGLFFERRKYDLSRVGRYKFNKKLSLAYRIMDRVAAKDIVSPDGIVLVKKGGIIEPKLAFSIQNSGINEVSIKTDGADFIVIGNNHVRIDEYLDAAAKGGKSKVSARELGINEMVHFPTLMSLINEAGSEKKLHDLIKENASDLMIKHITIEDIIATINYTLGLHHGIGHIDNIDHLGNRRVRSVGELLQNQFRVGISRLEKVIRERMQIQSDAELTPQTLINIRPVSSAIKEFFGSSQLSQFMDESNPIAELTHKRKLSALGPGGLNRERASFDVRDVHYTHYSRMCPIETPEGQNIGLISSLGCYSRINEYGFIEAPYRKIDKANKCIIPGAEGVEYIAADEEDRFVIAQATEQLDQNNWFINNRIMARYRDDIFETAAEEIDYVDVSPRQMVSVATALIPFLENDDTNRALMGSNMQRQAVPLLRPEAPIIATGVEHKIAYDSGVMIIARESGIVKSVDAECVVIQEDNGDEASYYLKKFVGSNQGTCINQRAIVHKGEKVLKGAVLADGHSTYNAELALGRNILVGFMAWEGYNYEDAILISERIVKDDVFTSIHIEEHELEARDTKLGEEEITRDIPNVGDDALKQLDSNGIVRVGAEVNSGDILVGKVTPKGETELTPEERLLRAIFGEKAREVRDTSLRVPHGEGGIVVDVKVFTRANKDEMSPGVNKLVRVYIAQKRKISVGDKMAGRHGNKGVISRILPQEDMPFMADGTPLEIVLNPLGVPSRMNIGQVLEVHLGLVAKALDWKIATPVFDGALESDIEQLLTDNGFTTDGKADGKVQMFDGRTGEPFENRATVGYMYMIKLIHLVDDKIHARSTGPYSLVTQQPLGGKAQFGGQRFGEMEVWALYAYGAANILQEIMTVKSDDVIGRVKTYESIVKGLNLSEPGVPESFKVLIKELEALALNVKVLTENNEEIGMTELIEDEIDDPDIVGRKKGIEGGVIQIEDEVDITLGDDILDGLGDDEDEDIVMPDKKEINFDDLDTSDVLRNDDDFDFDDPFANMSIDDEDDEEDLETKKKGKKK